MEKLNSWPIVTIIVVLVTIMAISAVYKTNSETNASNSQQITHLDENIDMKDARWEIIVIDSCEYIVWKGDEITHHSGCNNVKH